MDERELYVHATLWLEKLYGPVNGRFSLSDFAVREYINIEYPTGWVGFCQDMAHAGNVS